MQIVIDIPKRIYNDILSKNEHGIIFNAVKNGTPLPKGHGDLVDYEEMKNIAREYGAYAEAILSHIKPKTIIEADEESEEQA